MIRDFLLSADQASRSTLPVPSPSGTGRPDKTISLVELLRLARLVQSRAATDADLWTLISAGWQDQPAVEAAIGLVARVDPVKAAMVVRSTVEDPDTNAVVDEVSAKVPEAKVAGLTRSQILLLILTWLVAMGIPFVATQLPNSGQVVVANEIATVGLALVIADKIRKQN